MGRRDCRNSDVDCFISVNMGLKDHLILGDSLEHILPSIRDMNCGMNFFSSNSSFSS